MKRTAIAWTIIIIVAACGSDEAPTSTSAEARAAEATPAPESAPPAPAVAAPSGASAADRFFAFAERARANSVKICDCLTTLSMGMMSRDACMKAHVPKGGHDPAKKACIEAAFALDAPQAAAFLECVESNMAVVMECFDELDCADPAAVRGSAQKLAGCAQRLAERDAKCTLPEALQDALDDCERDGAP